MQAAGIHIVTSMRIASPAIRASIDRRRDTSALFFGHGNAATASYVSSTPGIPTRLANRATGPTQSYLGIQSSPEKSTKECTELESIFPSFAEGL